jgi:hypothetical protein
MHVSFLSPWSALIGLCGIVPLVAFLLAERRAARVAAAVGLPRRRVPRLAIAVALAVVAALLGAAAAEPVVDRDTRRSTRTDAQVFVVFDISRSMLARTGAHGRTRLERAKAFALRLRAALPDIDVGVASMTDRTLPHLLPSADEGAFRSVVTKAIGIERPAPTRGVMERITTLAALDAVATANFFSPEATHRLVVFLSDTETRPFDEDETGRVFEEHHIRALVVRFWHPAERVYVRGTAELGYRPDPSSALYAGVLAELTRGRAVTEGKLGAAVAAARQMLGTGPTLSAGEEGGSYSLAPYAALLGVVPLGFLLWRRNL